VDREDVFAEALFAILGEVDANLCELYFSFLDIRGMTPAADLVRFIKADQSCQMPTLHNSSLSPGPQRLKDTLNYAFQSAMEYVSKQAT
jgi:hypothetical protein